jgi:uncharacterized DUF497 family protein
MTFEWDPAEARRNLEKHGVDFEDVEHAFRGRLLERKDDRRDYGEERWRALGEVDGVVLEIVYTRGGRAIRLVSAWKAGKRRREAFHRAFGSAHRAAGPDGLEAAPSDDRRRGGARGGERS